jgi:hypothetical protein
LEQLSPSPRSYRRRVRLWQRTCCSERLRRHTSRKSCPVNPAYEVARLQRRLSQYPIGAPPSLWPPRRRMHEIITFSNFCAGRSNTAPCAEPFLNDLPPGRIGSKFRVGGVHAVRTYDGRWPTFRFRYLGLVHDPRWHSAYQPRSFAGIAGAAAPVIFWTLRRPSSRRTSLVAHAHRSAPATSAAPGWRVAAHSVADLPAYALQ